nr:tRNA-dihydrouridine(16/17) synthase [NAD(P)(+)]-like protein [Polyrhizophydium stewartii]
MATKLRGFELYKALGSPKHIVAPMVEQSELAWRILSRRYGAELCYTPMFHARLFSEDPKYRATHFTTNAEDRPLVVQFCANDPQTLLQAAKLVETQCDAVDLNLGCPQGIAKKGNYGAFLMEDWDLIASMVRTLHENLAIPVTCKIRVFPEVEKTIAYAKMLQDAGCQLLTVHGRLREQKGQLTGLADWSQIKRVKEVLTIPVFANGNILYKEDVARCIAETGVDGVMSAEGNLYNPAIFSGKFPPTCEVAQEFLDIYRDHPNSSDGSMIKAHLFKMFHACLALHPEMRERLGRSQSFEDLQAFVDEMKRRVQIPADAPEFDPLAAPVDSRGVREVPHWLLQPFVRPDVEVVREKLRASTEANAREAASRRSEKRKKAEASGPGSPQPKRRKGKTLCPGCKNIGSDRCAFQMCKACCRANALENARKLGIAEEPGQIVCESHKTSAVKKPVARLENGGAACGNGAEQAAASEAGMAPMDAAAQ